jgi:hypothetical protein
MKTGEEVRALLARIERTHGVTLEGDFTEEELQGWIATYAPDSVFVRDVEIKGFICRHRNARALGRVSVR